VRLLAERTTCNLRTQRIALVAPEQLGKLIRDAVGQRALDGLRCFAETTVEHFLDGGDAHQAKRNFEVVEVEAREDGQLVAAAAEPLGGPDFISSPAHRRRLI
jgi:hypothetical protein